MEPVVGKAGTGVYVVDNEYRIAYFNEVLEHFYPDLQLGSPCYRELCGRTAPVPRLPFGRDPRRQDALLQPVDPDVG